MYNYVALFKIAVAGWRRYLNWIALTWLAAIFAAPLFAVTDAEYLQDFQGVRQRPDRHRHGAERRQRVRHPRPARARSDSPSGCRSEREASKAASPTARLIGPFVSHLTEFPNDHMPGQTHCTISIILILRV
jgi:hypothetical protein